MRFKSKQSTESNHRTPRALLSQQSSLRDHSLPFVLTHPPLSLFVATKSPPHPSTSHFPCSQPSIFSTSSAPTMSSAREPPPLHQQSDDTVSSYPEQVECTVKSLTGKFFLNHPVEELLPAQYLRKAKQTSERHSYPLTFSSSKTQTEEPSGPQKYSCPISSRCRPTQGLDLPQR